MLVSIATHLGAYRQSAYARSRGRQLSSAHYNYQIGWWVGLLGGGS